MKPNDLARVRDEYLSHWGALGSSWGVNRTMAQIHALLMVSPAPLTTDQVMAELSISRGNAHTNLRELTGWGLVRSVVRKGERREHFEAEKDVWRIFCTVARERKRREVDPVIGVLRKCLENARDLKGPEAAAFARQMRDLLEFTEMAASLLDRLARSEKSAVLPLALKLLK